MIFSGMDFNNPQGFAHQTPQDTNLQKFQSLGFQKSENFNLQKSENLNMQNSQEFNLQKLQNLINQKSENTTLQTSENLNIQKPQIQLPVSLPSIVPDLMNPFNPVLNPQAFANVFFQIQLNSIKNSQLNLLNPNSSIF